MTLNPKEAQRQNNELSDAAQQQEILDILKVDGPCFVCEVARSTGLKATEVRWHLEQMKDAGEVSLNWMTMRYSAS